jgi:hypothetical protein
VGPRQSCFIMKLYACHLRVVNGDRRKTLMPTTIAEAGSGPSVGQARRLSNSVTGDVRSHDHRPSHRPQMAATSFRPLQANARKYATFVRGRPGMPHETIVLKLMQI